MIQLEPFNDIFYKSCYYNSIISVLNYYQLNITPLMLFDIYYYDCQVNESCFKVQISNQEIMPVTDILHKMGLKLLTQCKERPVISNIKEMLDLSLPVITWVDCYYLTYRKDTYHKEHWPHTLLFYDYFKENDYLKIIEHDKKETLTYRCKSISATDVQASYEGYLENFWDRENESFYSVDKTDKNQYDAIDLKKLYFENLKNHSYRIAAGLDTLKDLNTTIIDQISQDWLNNNKMQILIQGVNNMLLIKSSLLYLYNRILEPQHILVTNTQEIQKLIRLLRDVLMKCYYAGEINKAAIQTRLCFDSILQRESECLFAIQ